MLPHCRFPGVRLRRTIAVLMWAVWGAMVPTLAPAEESAQPARSFRPAEPGYRFVFPRDHGSHPAFHTEWWYYTGHLQAEGGPRFGYQLTFFRRALRPRPPGDPPPHHSRWRLYDLYLGHLALSHLDDNRFYFEEKLSREGLGKAGAEEDRLHVWIDRWQLDLSDTEPPVHHLMAQGETLAIDLRLTPTKAPVIHGSQGVSRKGSRPDESSHYYSLPRLRTTGTLVVGNRSFSVTGQSWMDHEFGSGDLANDLVGWDWFSIQLHSGEELMLYRLREADGRPSPASSGTWIDREGHGHLLAVDAVRVEVLERWISPHSKAEYPSRWRVTIPSLSAVFEISPEMADQELRTTHSTQVTYWEGAVRVAGTVNDRAASGEGYVELTGYAERYRPKL